jgi:hypothetical protein
MGPRLLCCHSCGTTRYHHLPSPRWLRKTCEFLLLLVATQVPYPTILEYFRLEVLHSELWFPPVFYRRYLSRSSPAQATTRVRPHCWKLHPQWIPGQYCSGYGVVLANLLLEAASVPWRTQLMKRPGQNSGCFACEAAKSCINVIYCLNVLHDMSFLQFMVFLVNSFHKGIPTMTRSENS